MGDLNSRCATKNDFISQDELFRESLDLLSDITRYSTDESSHTRINPDLQINTYGNKLLNVCIESGLRILNSGHHGNESNEFTYYGPVMGVVLSIMYSLHQKCLQISRLSR